MLGPSGCGKTTTLRLIAGFEQPTAGRILLDGVDVSRTPPEKRNVNTVFQNYALFPFLSAQENVAFGLRYQRLAKPEITRRVGEALELVEMGALRQAQAGRALRRTAATDRPRQGARPQPGGAAARRADGCARRQAAARPQGRAQGAAGAGRHHLPLRHPRPGGSPHDVRSTGRHVQRPAGADRITARRLRGAGLDLRRRLPRRLEPDDHRRRRHRTRIEVSGSAGGHGVAGRCQRRQPARSGPALRPARERRAPVVRPGGRELRPGHDRAHGVPRAVHAGLRPAGSRTVPAGAHPGEPGAGVTRAGHTGQRPSRAGDVARARRDDPELAAGARSRRRC